MLFYNVFFFIKCFLGGSFSKQFFFHLQDEDLGSRVLSLLQAQRTKTSNDGEPEPVSPEI